ncbi:MAG: acyltransferase [Nitrospirota bacterium]
MNRIESVDVFRLLAVIAVITLHSAPLSADLARDDEIYKYLDVVMNQIARFAVPFFFVISGYFWGLKVRRTDNPIPLTNIMAKRIGIIFISWCFIYLLPLNLSSIFEYGILGPVKVVYWNILNLAKQPTTLLMQGTRDHLWFLVGLLFSLYISVFFVHKRFVKTLFVFSIFLYTFGLLAKAYSSTPVGIDVDFNTRNGPFFGLLLFVSGFMISRFDPSVKWLSYGLLISCFGFVLHFSEIYLLWKYFGISLEQDYVIGTYFMGVGVATVALSNHRIFRVPALSTIGRMVLGIYAIHVIFVDLFRVVDKQIDHPFWEISYVILVLGLSVVSVVLLSKNRITQKIVV